MAHKNLNDPERINTEILQEWLTGSGKQPVNWTTLVEILHDIKLPTLAGEIEAVKCPAGEECALDQKGRNPVPVQDLLLFDPYSTDTSTELLRNIFGGKHSVDEEMKSHALEILNSEFEKNATLHLFIEYKDYPLRLRDTVWGAFHAQKRNNLQC